jgi:hypothetical protein
MGPSRKGPSPFIRVAVRVSSLTFNADTSARMRDLQPARSTKRAGPFIRVPVRMPTRAFRFERPGMQARPSTEATHEARWTVHPRGSAHAAARVPRGTPARMDRPALARF